MEHNPCITVYFVNKYWTDHNFIIQFHQFNFIIFFFQSLLKVVDIPGHERLRGKFFDMFKNTAKGLVFVIDSGSIQKDVKDVAEYLYNCLSDSVVRKNLPSLLILCNKQDEPLAKGSAVIKSMLEKEM